MEIGRGKVGCLPFALFIFYALELKVALATPLPTIEEKAQMGYK